MKEGKKEEANLIKNVIVNEGSLVMLVPRKLFKASRRDNTVFCNANNVLLTM